MRAYCYDGINQADDYTVVFFDMIRKDDDWKCEGIHTHIWARAPYEGRGSFDWTNSDGVFSPYPRENGNGYDEHLMMNSIGNNQGCFVNIGPETQIKFKDFNVHHGGENNCNLDHDWEDDPGETIDWDGATVGGCWYTSDDLGNAEMRVEDLRISYGYGWLEQTKHYSGVTWVYD